MNVKRPRSLAGPAFAFLSAGALLTAACGGSKGTLAVHILVPPDDDVFASAAQVRMTVADQITTAPVSGGRFDVKLDIEEPSQEQYTYLTVEALDGGGGVIGRGRSPAFTLTTQESEITVYVGRPGRVTRTAVDLLADKTDRGDTNEERTVRGRRDLSGVALRGRQVAPVPERALGVLLYGGADEAGNVMKSAWLYDPLTHRLVAAGAPQRPVRGGVVVPSADAEKGQEAILWGGAPVQGGVEGQAPTMAEIFDPAVSTLGLVFRNPSAEVADPGGPAAVQPVAVEVKEGVFLVSGGRAAKGAPDAPDVATNQAVLLQRYPAPDGSMDKSARPGARRIPPPQGMNSQGPMAATRHRHSATPVILADGPGVLLFGGAAMDAPVAEVFSLARLSFSGLSLSAGEGMPPVVSRTGHVAALLKGGKVLIAGGAAGDPEQVLDSALIIDPGSGQVAVRERFLATPRRDASVSLIADEVLICGGLGVDGKAVASCEAFAADGSGRSREPFALPNARAGHLALRLETDQLILVGGVGSEGKPLSAIDLYTSPR